MDFFNPKTFFDRPFKSTSSGFVLIITILFFASTKPVCGQEPETNSIVKPNVAVTPNQIRVVFIKGTISRKLLETIRQRFGANPNIENAGSANLYEPPNPEPFPAGLIVLLDSKGGDGMAAMEIGRILRRAQAHVFVTGECSSACVFILASGVMRGAPTFSVGIHQGRITLSSDAGVIKKEVDIKEDPKAKALLAKFEVMAKAYFAEMGIPNEFFQAMQDHSTRGVYRLTSQEITLYGLNGFDEDYLTQRVNFYQSRKGRWTQLDKDELYRRTSKVASECAPFDSKQQEFVNCYKKVLLDMY